MSKIIFFGSPDYVLPIPASLINSGNSVAAVVTQPPKPVGRKQIITPSDVARWAKKNNILVIESLKELEEKSAGLGAEVGIVASFGQIIPENIINSFPQGILNIHPSSLPKYRGASPLQNAILDGLTETAVTIIKMDEKMDHGPIVAQEPLDILEGDTFESLRTRAFEKASQMLTHALSDYLEGKIELLEQDHAIATYTWTIKETKEKAYFDINPPAGGPPSPEILEWMTRAFYPWPIAWTRWNNKIIKLFPEKMIQMEGKRPVKYEEFIKAYPEFPIKL